VHRRSIKSLADHPDPYVTTTELAEYWMVSRKQIYKQIEAGTLKAIRLGPRLLRIRTSEALEFERLAKMVPDRSTAGPQSGAEGQGAAAPFEADPPLGSRRVARGSR
jgi:excisionase family DNA binding protein